MKDFIRNKMTRKKVVSLLLLLSMLVSNFSDTGTVIKAEAANQKENVVAEQDITETKTETEYGVVVDYPEKGSEIYENLEDYPTGGLESDNKETPDENTVSTAEELRDELLEDDSASLLGEANGASTASINYPRAVDNSTNVNKKYFPNIIRQKGGSCVCASFVYTLGTYTINKARNLDSSKPENQLSPYFLYNLIRTGASDSNGCFNSSAGEYLKKIGSPTLDLLPDTSANYSNNLYSLYPGEEIWADAGSNQITDYICLKDFSHTGTPITSATDSDLDIMKEAISAGKLIGMATRFYTFNYSTIPSASKSHAGENVIDRCDRYVSNGSGRDYGNHAMVIVGYDDEIWVDINHDGIAQAGEYGAFKIANSHGTGYMDQGFVWVAYDAINAVSSVLTSADEARINAAVDAGLLSCPKVSSANRMEFFQYNGMYTFTAAKKEDTTAGAFLVLDLENANRYAVRVTISAKNKSTGTSAGSYTFKVPFSWQQAYSFSGKRSTTTDTLAFNLSNVVSDTNLFTLLQNYDYTVTISGSSQNATYVVDNLAIKKDGICYGYVLPEELENNNTITGVDSKSYNLTMTDLEWREVVAQPASGRVSDGEEVTFTAECSPNENMEYEFVLKYDLKEQVVREYSKDPTFTWTSKFSFYPTEMIVNFKNTVTGEIEKKSIVYRVNKKLVFSGISGIPETMELGQTTTPILISGEGGTGTLKRIIEIKYGESEKTLFYSGPQGSDLFWTPEKAGDYTIYLSLEDENGIRITKEKKCTVTKPDTNTATVYYANSSWSNAYIHYKVGDGQWTTVPGKQMSKSSEQSGYTWKYEIDLGTGDRATVCFNNGSGSWDSKNGANYTVYTGVSGIKNETVTPLTTVTPTVKPTATPTAKPTATPTAKPTATPTVKPTATPTIIPGKNTATVYYANSSWNTAYIHYKVDNGSWTSVPGVKMEESSAQDGYTWRYVIDLGEESNATVCFNNGNNVWDSKNGANYTVSKGTYGIKNGSVTELTDGLDVSVEIIGSRGSSSAYTTVKDGVAPYTYSYVYTENGEKSEEITRTSDSNTNYITITSYNGGTYKVDVMVTDAEGKTGMATAVKELPPLYIADIKASAASPQKTGTTVTFTADIQSEFVYKFPNYKTWTISKDGVVCKSTYNTSNTITYTFEEAGTYVIKCVAKDATPQEAEKTIQFVISDETNVATIYYSTGWDNAYIHYCVAGKSWTNVPGVKMIPATEQSGYNYKMTINLEESDQVTVCFNNGNGSWDSKNGANYTIKAGTYGVKDGIVTKLK